MMKAELDFYETTKDAEILYAQGIRGITLGTVRNNAVMWKAGYKYKEKVTIFDTDSVNYYYVFGKTGSSRLMVGTLGFLFGPIASTYAMRNGLGWTYLIYLELKKQKNAFLIIRCHEDYFKHIRTNCYYSLELNPKANKAVTDSKLIQDYIKAFKR